MPPKSKQSVEEVVPVPDGSETSNGDVLDAVRELTSTVSELITAIDGMRKEYGLKNRAGIFDQKGVS
jgi:hypothetical protein